MQLKNAITVVGAHAEGEVGRVITGGVIAPSAPSMYECLEAFEAKHDWVRGLLLSDPRGSVNAAVNMVTPPISPEADFGMIVIESDYYPPMSGSNLICTVTAVLETGMVAMQAPITNLCVDTPAGLVYVRAECEGGKCRRVSFKNVPSFVMHRSRPVEVEGLGTLTLDVAYGGMIYAIVDAASVGFSLDQSEARELVEVGERIKAAAAAQLPSVHPVNTRIHTINQTLFAGPLSSEAKGKTAKNAVVVSPGRLDRSPCGTGSSARMALMHARGELQAGEPFVHKSILDTEFHCRFERADDVGDTPAIIPMISGRAWLTGLSYYGADPEDPFPKGYRLNDTWFGPTT